MLTAIIIAVVTLGTASPSTYKCIKMEKCHTRHDLTVFHRCGPVYLGNVWCPDIQIEGRAFLPLATTITTPTLKKPQQLKHHKNFKLIPNSCGTNELRKLNNRPSIRIKVYGGEEAEEGAYPWMTLLFTSRQIGSDTVSWPFCGGSLINNRYVLTAAHCLYGNDTILKFVRLGVHDYRLNNCSANKDRCPVSTNVSKVIIHPNYNNLSKRHDIALLRLEQDVLKTKNLKIRPICLPFDLNVTTKEKSRFTVAGWGKTRKINEQGNFVLLHANLTATGQCPMCPKGGIIQPLCPLSSTEQLCIETQNGDGPCQAGIVSFSPGTCGDRNVPVVYNRVDAYLSWILDNIRS